MSSILRIVSLIQAGVVVFTPSISHAQAPYDAGTAFSDGKGFKSALPALKEGIVKSDASKLPGADSVTAPALGSLYGTDILKSGGTKATDCGTYVPSSDAYKNQECETINFVVGNPKTKPVVTISRKTDPLIIKGSGIIKTPGSHVSGTSGLSGSSTACTDKVTSYPAEVATERCQIGHEVQEGTCPATLKPTYTFEVFTGQPLAEPTYGRCTPGEFRGDLLPLPLTNTYPVDPVPCETLGFGIGTALQTTAIACNGTKTPHGFDASACSMPPRPAVVTLPQPYAYCSDAPRLITNCFTPAGKFTGPTTVPVFVNVLDDSACTTLKSFKAVIK